MPITSSSLDGMKVAILVSDGFEQSEMTEPRKALDLAGAQTRIVSPVGRVRGWNHHDPADSFPAVSYTHLTLPTILRV